MFDDLQQRYEALTRGVKTSFLPIIVLVSARNGFQTHEKEELVRMMMSEIADVDICFCRDAANGKVLC